MNRRHNEKASHLPPHALTKADVDRLYVLRPEGGGGFFQLELSYKTTTIGFQRYLATTEYWIKVCVKEQENGKWLFSVIKGANKFKKEFQVGDKINVKDNTPTEAAKYLKKQKQMQLTR